MKPKHKSRDPKNTESVAGNEDGGGNILPRWAPFVVFAVVALFLFREFIISNGLLFGTDVMALGYFARSFYAEMVRTAHIFPLWNPYVFGGLPFVDAMHGDIFYPTTVLKFIIPVHRAMGWKLVLHVFLAGVVTFGWLRQLKVSQLIALFGGVTYMLAPVLVTLVYPGHDGKLFVSALTPLALWVTDWAITRGGAWRFATLSLVIALLIFTAHMQLAYYTTWAVLVLALFRLVQAWRERQPPVTLARRFGAFAVAGVVGGLAIGAVQLWTPLLYLTKYSQRVEKTIEAEAEPAYARATSWALHAEEAVSLIVPEFVGANINQPLHPGEQPINTYWGRNPFKLNHEYGGLIPLLLLPLAFFTRRRRGEVWLFTGLAAASLIYALGATTPLFYLYYYLVPGVKLFRAPSSIMFIFAIAVITVAAIGLDNLRRVQGNEEGKSIARKSGIYLWAVTGVLLVLALLGSAGVLTDAWVATLYRDIAPPKLQALQANLPNITRGLWLSVLLSGLVAGAWHLRRRGSIPQVAWVSALILLGALDMLRVDPQYIRVVNPGLYYPRDDTTEFLIGQRRNSSPFRVWPLSAEFGQARAPYQTNHFALYGLEELTGHHGNELGRYQDMVEPQRLVAENFRMLQLLNVRYIVSGSPIQAPGLQEAFRGQRSIVYSVNGILPRAFLTASTEVVPDSVTVDRLLDPTFHFRRTALYPEDPRLELDSRATGQVRWTERGINSQTLQVETEGPAALVISNNYYPAWKATVDGAPTRVLRADHSLMAIPVPAGSHEVRLEYRSGLLRAAAWTTVVSTLLALGLIGAALYRERRAAAASAEGKSG